MPKVHHIAKSRKVHQCGKCGKKIKKGSPYIHWSFRYAGKRVRCNDCPRPKPSELTASDKLSQVFAAQEQVEDAIAGFNKNHDLEVLRSDCESAAEELRNVAGEYQESAENIQQTFSESPVAEECEEKASSIESAADELESLLENFEELDLDKANDEELEDWVATTTGELEGFSVEV